MTWRRRLVVRLGGAATSVVLALALAASALAQGGSPATSLSSESTDDRELRQTAVAVSPGTITFDEFSLGTPITDQYATEGVIFSGDQPFITTDGINPTSPVLAGSPKFFGEIRGTFTLPGFAVPITVNGFTLDVGFIDDRNSVEVAYFDAAGSRLGAVRANQNGINRIVVAARVSSFAVRAIEQEPAGFGIDNLTIQRAPSGVRPTRIASLGDSYSSGEGNLSSPYDCGTDLHRGSYREDTTKFVLRYRWRDGVDCVISTGSHQRPADITSRPFVTYHNLCHRHGRAYPNQIRELFEIASEDAIFVACSGAVTANIGAGDPELDLPATQYSESPHGVHGGQTQIQNVRDFAAAGGAPDVVTVGVGGNNAEFADIVRHCIFFDCADQDSVAGVRAQLQGEAYPRIVGTFEALRGEFPSATIVSFGYPRVVSPELACSGLPGVDEDERRYVAETLLPELNSLIADASVEAGITFVDISEATRGHEICAEQDGRTPWVNGLEGGDDILGVIGNESFHPNQAGHDAITAHFRVHYTSDGRLTFVNPDPRDVIRPPSQEVRFRIGGLSAGLHATCGVECVQPTACVGGCEIVLRGQGYEPGSELRVTVQPVSGLSLPLEGFRLQETDVVLGAVRTDALGRLDAAVAVPSGLATGQHAVVLQGSLANGGTQVGTALFAIQNPPPICAVISDQLATPRSRMRRARFTLSTTQLRINQRISQAAVRRVNAAVARFEGRPALPASARDRRRAARFTLTIAQLRINQRIAAAAVRRVNALTARLDGHALEPSPPRSGGRARFTLSTTQLRINQRISAAAVRRVNAIDLRLDGREAGCPGL